MVLGVTRSSDGMTFGEFVRRRIDRVCPGVIPGYKTAPDESSREITTVVLGVVPKPCALPTTFTIAQVGPVGDEIYPPSDCSSACEGSWLSDFNANKKP